MTTDQEYRLYGKKECEKRWNISTQESAEFWRIFSCKPIKVVYNTYERYTNYAHKNK